MKEAQARCPLTQTLESDALQRTGSRTIAARRRDAAAVAGHPAADSPGALPGTRNPAFWSMRCASRRVNRCNVKPAIPWCTGMRRSPPSVLWTEERSKSQTSQRRLWGSQKLNQRLCTCNTNRPPGRSSRYVCSRTALPWFASVDHAQGAEQASGIIKRLVLHTSQIYNIGLKPLDGNAFSGRALACLP